MHNKRLLVLLLILSLIIALAACAKQQTAPTPEETAVQTPPREPISGEYDDAIAEMQALYQSPSLESYSAMTGGAFLSEEIAAYYGAILEVTGADEQTLLSDLGLAATDTTIIVTQEQPMTDEQLAEYRARLGEMAAAYETWLTERGAFSDADWDALAANMENATGAQLKETFQKMQPAVASAQAKLAAANLSEGKILTCIATAADGTQSENVVPMLCIDGSWVSEAVFSSMQLL